MLADLSRLMAKKLKEPLSHELGLVNGRISIAVEEVVTYFIVTCDEKAFMDTYKSLMYRELLRASVTFF